MKGHNLHPHGWIAILAVLVLVAAHVVFFGIVARMHLSVTLYEFTPSARMRAPQAMH